jgi:hypothetical protein
MMRISNYPPVVFVIAFLAQWIAAWLGARWSRRRGDLDGGFREDFGMILAAALTLLGLIIGFSFSMAITRYDHRKNLEEAEANAIGTEFVRADLLPPTEGERLRKLLRDYVDQRVLFYVTHDESGLARVNAEVTRLQNELWAVVRGPAAAQPTPINALVVLGMNDVLNSQGYTQAAWWNRIPPAAWVCCSALAGYGARNPKAERFLLLVLPLIVSISLFLIADIDSPRGGVIRVQPQNLQSLSDALRVH